MHPKIKMMKQLIIRINLILCTALLIVAQTAFSQAVPTASQSLQLSAFGGLTGVFTDLEGGHNLSITAGLDLAFLSLHGFHPAARFTGTCFLEDIRARGNNAIGLGIPWWEPGGGENHPDGVVLMHSLWIDDTQLVRDGVLVGPPEIVELER